MAKIDDPPAAQPPSNPTPLRPINVQFGPTPAAPGSRLKKDRK